MLPGARVAVSRETVVVSCSSLLVVGGVGDRQVVVVTGRFGGKVVVVK
jgi:hypothetical protein